MTTLCFKIGLALYKYVTKSTHKTPELYLQSLNISKMKVLIIFAILLVAVSTSNRGPGEPKQIQHRFQDGSVEEAKAAAVPGYHSKGPKIQIAELNVDPAPAVQII